MNWPPHQSRDGEEQYLWYLWLHPLFPAGRRIKPCKDTDNMQIEHGQGPEVQFSTNTIFLIIGVQLRINHVTLLENLPTSALHFTLIWFDWVWFIMKHAILPYNSKEYCRRKGHKLNPLISTSFSSKQMECVSSSLPTSIWYWVFHSLICLQWVSRKQTKLRPPPLTLHKSQKMLPYREKVA